MNKLYLKNKKLNKTRSALILLSCLFLFVNVVCQKEPEDIKIDTSNQKDSGKIKFKKQGEVSFQDTMKNLITKIDVEIAETDDTRHLGLMYRENMQENQGMLFIFPDEDFESFYMKNTIIPLDIIFINAKKQIVKIHKNTVPYSEKSLPSLKPSMYVVEVNAGFTDKYKIKEGEFIDWRRN
jgi:uncharacterized membrane protein (UPF0127 family)